MLGIKRQTIPTVACSTACRPPDSTTIDAPEPPLIYTARCLKIPDDGQTYPCSPSSGRVADATSHTVKICRLIPSTTPGPLDDAGREGFAELQCWGGGEVPVVASDCERTGHDRGTKVTTESLSATMRQAQSVGGNLSCAFSNWRSPVYSLLPSS